MKKKIFYWSPCLNPVGTVISTANSALALSKFSDQYEVSIINTCGEWDKFTSEFTKNNIDVINLNFAYFKILPKTGFLKSRFSYIVIFILSFFPLIFLLKNKKPDIFIAHLITSLPILIFKFFTLHTSLILRISGMPRLNFFRKNLWKFCSSKIKMITCPTIELKKNVKIFLAVGRLTKQKNFNYLINEFYKFYLENKNCRLVILGDGEEFNSLNSLIIKKQLTKVVYLLGRVENVLRYMKDSDAFILSSKWEEMGFVIIESALTNLYIISSNCPNGPTEFLNNGINGLLYENNKDEALYKALKDFEILDEKKKKKMIV